MKRGVLIVCIAAVIGIIGWGGHFYYKNLRGVAPAITKPDQAISDIINTAGMPLSLPPGFSIAIFAKDLDDPRVITHDPLGTILVSIPGEGKIVALPDKDGDGIADKAITVVDGLDHPHGMAFMCGKDYCHLYVGETSALSQFDYNGVTMTAMNRQVMHALSSDGNHTTRTLLFDPSDSTKLLVSIGSSCNVCNETDEQRASIYEYDTVTGAFAQYAKGLRNSVFMAVHPVTGEIWATENSRDMLGDDIPPDEVNIIKKWNNYGWPICYGKNIHDTDFDKKTYIRNPCMEPFETPSYIDVQAHSAPLGLAFFGEETWPEQYWYNMLVAYHGSWNRTEPTGYKIVRYKLDAKGNVLGTEDFITGWLDKNDAIGRPVDIMIEPGKIYITDDKAGVIYLVKYDSEKQH
jgi:glucose/arabinose dehydrogenase